MSKRDRRDNRPAPQARTRSAGSGKSSRARYDDHQVVVPRFNVPAYQAETYNPPAYEPASTPQRRKAIQGKVLKPFQPSRLSFSYPGPTQAKQIAPRPDLTPCRASAIRREVLFATKSTGKGSHAPKVNFHNRRCK